MYIFIRPFSVLAPSALGVMGCRVGPVPAVLGWRRVGAHGRFLTGLHGENKWQPSALIFKQFKAAVQPNLREWAALALGMLLVGLFIYLFLNDS